MSKNNRLAMVLSILAVLISAVSGWLCKLALSNAERFGQ